LSEQEKKVASCVEREKKADGSLFSTVQGREKVFANAPRELPWRGDKRHTQYDVVEGLMQRSREGGKNGKVHPGRDRTGRAKKGGRTRSYARKP